MKVTKHETLYNEEHSATLKHKCGKKIVAIVPFLAFLFFFGLFLQRGFIDLAFPPMGQCSNNDDHHTFITTRYYNSILQQQSMTLYECLRRCTGMCNETRVTCMINYAWWPCHEYDVNYIIMHGNMTIWCVSYKRNGGKLHGNISRNGYGNAMIGRYGGCFEE